MRRNYSMDRVLNPLICVVWLLFFRLVRPKKEPPALAAEGSGKGARLVQGPHHP
jgi:hypothetical protein